MEIRGTHVNWIHSLFPHSHLPAHLMASTWFLPDLERNGKQDVIQQACVCNLQYVHQPMKSTKLHMLKQNILKIKTYYWIYNLRIVHTVNLSNTAETLMVNNLQSASIYSTQTSCVANMQQKWAHDDLVHATYQLQWSSNSTLNVSQVMVLLEPWMHTYTFLIPCYHP